MVIAINRKAIPIYKKLGFIKIEIHAVNNRLQFPSQDNRI
ncbi:hypothetical protein RVIR1_13260 [Candidatus Rickettsiella viridis]|uniref:Uncharacterized protein n=1 Tax=Candidatus Rickettsiella viridis TaxID=676208 RepID=A0A2Z5UXG0_9COXI|nr:hypothetical protein RVIR1_13260 [Candidatus Rickettsiella viridis]